jgi:hypothetical protein
MELNGLSTPVSPIQNNPMVLPQAVSQPFEGEPEVAVGEEGSGKAKGVVSKLNEGGHFKGVANIRLRIAHFDNPDLEPIDPGGLPDPENVSGKAYEKFLVQNEDKYVDWLASQSPAEPEEPVVVVPEPDPDLAITVEPLSEPDVSAIEIPETDPIIVTPLEIEPIAVPEHTEPEVPVDQDKGALAAFEELLETQASTEEPETLDIVI